MFVHAAWCVCAFWCVRADVEIGSPGVCSLDYGFKSTHARAFRATNITSEADDPFLSSSAKHVTRHMIAKMPMSFLVFLALSSGL